GCVLVTHRGSLLSLVNRLIVIEKGRIAADGPRDQVLRQLAGAAERPPAAPAEKKSPPRPSPPPQRT
ncbi:MAG: hypothetical protein H7831_16450, partial [Magnetococcus sp. WYHC-3]